MTAALEILANQSYTMMQSNSSQFSGTTSFVPSEDHDDKDKNFKKRKGLKLEKLYSFENSSDRKDDTMDSYKKNCHRLLIKKRRRTLSPSNCMFEGKRPEEFENSNWNRSLSLLHEKNPDHIASSITLGSDMKNKSDSDQTIFERTEADDDKRVKGGTHQKTKAGTDQTDKADTDQQFEDKVETDTDTDTDQAAEIDTDHSAEEEERKTVLNKSDEESPYRRLSMLAAASLLDSANSNKFEEKSKSTGTESRRSSMDFSETVETMESMSDTMMARRHSFMYGDVENAILARRMSLYAAQAASYETQFAKRRASLIAAAGVFESLTKERSRRNSLLGSTPLSLSRRNSLLAVSSLLNNLENSNDPLKVALRRRGSDLSLASFDSSSSGRSSLDHLHNNLNLIQRHQEMLNRQMMSLDEKEKKSNVVSMESFKSLYVSMEKSKASQIAIHDWDRKMGLRRSHSQTMRNSSRSRKKLITVMVVGKGDTKGNGNMF